LIRIWNTGLHVLGINILKIITLGDLTVLERLVKYDADFARYNNNGESF